MELDIKQMVFFNITSKIQMLIFLKDHWAGHNHGHGKSAHNNYDHHGQYGDNAWDNHGLHSNGDWHTHSVGGHDNGHWDGWGNKGHWLKDNGNGYEKKWSWDKEAGVNKAFATHGRHHLGHHYGDHGGHYGHNQVCHSIIQN